MNDYEQLYNIEMAFRIAIKECWKYRNLPINRSLCKRLVKSFRKFKETPSSLL